MSDSASPPDPKGGGGGAEQGNAGSTLHDGGGGSVIDGVDAATDATVQATPDATIRDGGSLADGSDSQVPDGATTVPTPDSGTVSCGDVKYSSRLTITKRGTYTGNWESTDPQYAAVTVSTTEPVIIENANVRGPGPLIKNGVGQVDVTVRNTRGTSTNPQVANIHVGRFVEFSGPASAIIEHCTMEHTAGILLVTSPASESTSPTKTIHLLANQIRNVDRRMSDGKGGRLPPTGAGDHDAYANAISVNRIHAPDFEIAWNEVVNEPGKSWNADLINMYNSGGADGHPLLVHDNYVQGTLTDLGDGILLGDTDTIDTVKYPNTAVYPVPSHIRGYDNQVVDFSGTGMLIAGGFDIQLYHNRVVSSGRSNRFGGATGYYMWDLHGQSQYGLFHDDSIHDNLAGVQRADGSRRDYEFRNTQCGDMTRHLDCSNNQSIPGPITADSEKAEWPAWQKKLSDNHMVAGATCTP